MVNLVDHDLPPITSDISKCRHILENLMGNAVKFTEEGKVEISARYSAGDVFIAVADTGIGISPEEVPHIFDEFRQADESASRRFGGSGLGLAIANKYALLLHGAITVNTTPGAGSTFILRLPMEIHSSLHSKNQDSSGPYQNVEKNQRQIGPNVAEVKNILLVEDSEPAVIQVMDILSEQGFRVQVARNGKEALEQIDIMPPAAMILDLMMPEVDGFEVLRTIRGREKTARLPVLILTAKHVTRDELKVLEGNNIQQLIAKGAVSKKELLAAVNKMVFPYQGSEAPSLGKTSTDKNSDKSTILVVEDNPDNMMTVKALLRETCNIIEASDGEAGLESARMFKPDLVLLDISLPGMDGFEVLAQIRKQEHLSRVPVIALTARAMKGSKEDIMAHGFDGYISKPIDGERLRKSIREILYAD
jgi:CheY-like chemotaxis protein/anti-sigma regulatory factor (Ser/Thr protein kinase)